MFDDPKNKADQEREKQDACYEKTAFTKVGTKVNPACEWRNQIFILLLVKERPVSGDKGEWFYWAHKKGRLLEKAKGEINKLTTD